MSEDFSKYEVNAPDDFSQYESTSKPEVPYWETALRNFSDAATFGQGNRIQAALRAPFESGNFSDAYNRLRKEELARTQTANEANPKTALAGTIAGSLPQGLSMARGAVLAGLGKVGTTQTAAQIVGGAQTGAKLGVLNAPGAVQDYTQPVSDTAIQAATPLVTNTIAGGAGPVVAKLGGYALSKVIPQVESTLGGSGSTTKMIRGTESETSKILKQATAGKLGALVGGGMGGTGNLKAVTGPVDWSSDPMGALGSTALAAGAGAALGVGGKVALGMGKDALNKGVIPAAKAIGQGTENIVNQGEKEPMFSTIDKFLHGTSQGSKELTVTGPIPPQGTEGADATTQRQAAMAEQSTSEGRASTNSTAPQNKTNSLQQYFKDIQNLPDHTPIEDKFPITTSPETINVESNVVKPQGNYQAVKDALGKTDSKNWDKLAQENGYPNFDAWNTENSTMIRK